MTATGQFDKSNEIGKGGYGRVFIAKNLRCKGTTAAVKVLTKVRPIVILFLYNYYYV